MNNLYQPEKLNFWDRIFNRYKKIPVNQGKETWFRNIHGIKIQDSEFIRSFVEYHKIDRLTGGYEVIKEYFGRPV